MISFFKISGGISTKENARNCPALSPNLPAINICKFLMAARLRRIFSQPKFVSNSGYFCKSGIAFHYPIAEAHNTLCMKRNFLFMGYEYNGIAQPVNLRKQGHDFQ